jgi:hypothetical protein
LKKPASQRHKQSVKHAGSAQFEKGDFGHPFFILTAVHADLLSLEERIVKAKNKHNEFLRELGLPLLSLANQGIDTDAAVTSWPARAQE